MKVLCHKIMDPEGLHARPVTQVAKCCMDGSSDVQVEYKGKKVRGDDPLALMSLYAEYGSELTIYIEGVDEDKVYEELSTILQ